MSSSPKEAPNGSHRVPWSIIPDTVETITLYDGDWNKIVAQVIEYEAHSKVELELEDDAYAEIERIAEEQGVSVNDAVVWLLRNCP